MSHSDELYPTIAYRSEILGRPKSEKAFLLIPVGFLAETCRVPDIRRKPLGEVLIVRA